MQHLGGILDTTGGGIWEESGRHLGRTLEVPIGKGQKPQILKKKIKKTEAKLKVGFRMRTKFPAILMLFPYDFASLPILQKHVVQNHRKIQGLVIFVFPHMGDV